jgi:predicted metalloprotease
VVSRAPRPLDGRMRWLSLVAVAAVLALASLGVLGTGTLGQSSEPGATEPTVSESPGAGDQLDSIVAMLFGGEDQPDSLGSFWTQTFPTFSDQPYHDPQGGFFPYRTGEASSGACGGPADDAAQNASYCDDDESITYDVTWLNSLLQDNGPAGPMTILAHEWGHHIQNLAGSPQISKQAELQADCYGGMYLGFLTDQGVLGQDDIRDSLRITYSVGDQPDEVGAWTDEDVHGAPNERRQAEGIGFSTGVGDYCVAFGDWQDQPAAPLFEDKSLRVEPFADPTPQADGSLLLELPNAEVDVSEVDLDAGTRAGPELASAIERRFPDASGWDIGQPRAGWLEDLGVGTGSGATTTFSGTAQDGSVQAGVAALQVDPDGTAQLYVVTGSDTTDASAAETQAQEALDALTWGYCDPEAEVTTNCPADEVPSTSPG